MVRYNVFLIARTSLLSSSIQRSGRNHRPRLVMEGPHSGLGDLFVARYHRWGMFYSKMRPSELGPRLKSVAAYHSHPTNRKTNQPQSTASQKPHSLHPNPVQMQLELLFSRKRNEPLIYTAAPDGLDLSGIVLLLLVSGPESQRRAKPASGYQNSKR